MALSNDLTLYPATIWAGASLSGPVSVGGQLLVGLSMPASWTAANLTFQISPDGVNWQEFYDGSGNEVIVQVAANLFVPLSLGMWKAVNMLTIRSGTVGSPVNQSAQAIINVVARNFA